MSVSEGQRPNQPPPPMDTENRDHDRGPGTNPVGRLCMAVVFQVAEHSLTVEKK